MYYERYETRRQRRKRRRSGCIGGLMSLAVRLLVLALTLALLACVLLWALPVNLMNVEPEGMVLSPTDGLPGERLNVLLLGLDAMDASGQRSDAIIVASFSYDSLRLTSLMRDTMVDIPGHGRHKLNAAYAFGGAELAMRTINETFRLNITNYIVADFRALVDAIDALDGIDIEVDEGELKYINKYAYNTFRVISSRNKSKYAHYAESKPITTTGLMHLNGLFATGYCRIRYSDSDYVRTARQREVLTAMLARFRQCCWNPLVYLRLFQTVREDIDTNLWLPELISLGEKAFVAGKIETFRLPMEPYLYDNGSSIEITDLDASVEALHNFIYASGQAS